MVHNVWPLNAAKVELEIEANLLVLLRF